MEGASGGSSSYWGSYWVGDPGRVVADLEVVAWGTHGVVGVGGAVQGGSAVAALVAQCGMDREERDPPWSQGETPEGGQGVGHWVHSAACCHRDPLHQTHHPETGLQPDS